jgi:hypothetical protein
MVRDSDRIWWALRRFERRSETRKICPTNGPENS